MSNCEFDGEVGLSSGTWILLIIILSLFFNGVHVAIGELEEKLNMVIRAHSGLTEQQLNDIQGNQH